MQSGGVGHAAGLSAQTHERMNAVMASTAKVKSSMSSLKGFLPTHYLSLLVPWLVGGAARLALNSTIQTYDGHVDFGIVAD